MMGELVAVWSFCGLLIFMCLLGRKMFDDLDNDKTTPWYWR